MSAPVPTPSTDQVATTVAPEAPADGTGAVGSSTPSTPAVSAGPLGQDEIDALQAALAADQAAVFSYGRVTPVYGAQDPLRATIAQVLQGHRTRRDLTEERLAQGGATPAESAVAYVSGGAVTDVASALQLAQDIEFDCAAAWRVVIGSTDQAELRGYALAGLSDAAVRMAQWKVLAGVSPSTVPFPGQG